MNIMQTQYPNNCEGGIQYTLANKCKMADNGQRQDVHRFMARHLDNK